MYKKTFLISLLIGIVWGFAAVYIAIEHNPQIAVKNPKEGYDIIYLANLFISWFSLVTFGLFSIVGLFIWLWRFFNVKQ